MAKICYFNCSYHASAKVGIVIVAKVQLVPQYATDDEEA